MARVTGIGGVFLRSADPARLRSWYAEHLHMTLSPYGSVNFAWSDEVPAGTGMTAWAVFPQDTEYFRSAQAVMLNLRVDDLDELLTELSQAGIWIDPKRDSQEYGKFAWIRDCDGNTVELWQPLA